MTNTRTINMRFVSIAAGGILMLAALTYAYTSSLAHAAITASSTAPIVSAVVATPSDTGATITWSTDQLSDTQVAYGPSAGSYNASTTLGDSTDGATSHTAFLGGLTPDTTYHFEVLSSNGETVGTSSDMVFTTTNTASTTASSTAPNITNVQVTPTDTAATITWSTDQSSNSQVVYGTTASYGNMSTLSDTGGVTSHTVTLTGLTASTMYHFAVVSANGSSTTATSTDMTFTTNAASSTNASSTPSVTTNVATNITSSDATLNATNGPVAAQAESFWVSPTPIDTSSPTIPSGVFSTPLLSGIAANASFSDPLSLVTTNGVPGNMSAIMSNTTYYFVPWVEVNGTWYPGQQMTVMTTAASSSTDISFLQSEISQLQQQVATLQAQVASLLGGGTGTTTGGGGNTGGNPTGATIDQNGMTISAGGSIDFSGRNFGHEESVNVMLDGSTIATAHADGGGNFSTGSIAGPTTPGTYTYTFLGANSGDNVTATITVQ